MSENFTPLLPTYDWNAEWKALQKQRRTADDSKYWDRRAKTFSTKDAPNSYVDQFIERANIRPYDTVFDMGCGTGAISIPLGMRKYTVIAADFSKGMLDVMQKELDAHGIHTVTPKLMSWEDDWRKHGMLEESVDVAIASRSIATADMRDSLMRLHAVAKRRVCITLSTGSSPRMDERILEAVGVENIFGHDFQYAVNILINEGLKPEVSYIESMRKVTYDSFEDAFDDLSRMVMDASRSPYGPHGSENEETKTPSPKMEAVFKRLRTWLKTHLVENPHAGEQDRKGIMQKRLQLDIPRVNTWAFIAWNK